MEQRAAWHKERGIIVTDCKAAGRYIKKIHLIYNLMNPGSNGCGAGFFQDGILEGVTGDGTVF